MTSQSSIPEFLRCLFEVAVAAAHPAQCLPPALPPITKGKALVVGAGKAAAAMARVFEDHWQGQVRGLVITRYGHGETCRRIQVVEAAHPVPDAAGFAAARRILDEIAQRRADEQVFFLLSGGASSLLALPAAGLDLVEKQQITRALLTSGATIEELNCVRKHLSAIKGGRLAALCGGDVTTLAISDVPGDDPSVIGSGPTVADPSTSAEALTLLERYRVPISAGVRNWLENPASETPKPGQLRTGPFQLLATPMHALRAAAEFARARGVTPLLLGDFIEGEAREVAKVVAGIARSIQLHGEPAGRPCVMISGGETSVSVRGAGRGGRNSEFLLALAASLRGQSGIYALAADTDGIDGSEDNAGAHLSPDTLTRARALGLSLPAALANNDSYGFFARLGDLLVVGPTRTNVNDFRAVYIE